MSKTLDQTKIFGNTRKAYNADKLKEYIKDEHYKAKKYFLQYFAKKTLSDYFFYCPSDVDEMGNIISLDSTEFNKFKSRFTKEESWIFSWFQTQHNDEFNIGVDPIAERFYEKKITGEKIINMSKGFLYKKPEKYSKISDTDKLNVKKFWGHIKNVWNSENKECYKYVKKWIIMACTGHKMKTCLFLKSGEGTGKSIVVDFLIEHVIGPALGFITARPDNLIQFNGQIIGKILVCLEELPAENKSTWHTLADMIKHLITGSKVDIEKKFKDQIQIDNLISLIIFTNHNNTLKFGNQARRYMMCDVSHDHVGDTEYFTDLSSVLNKETGYALFCYMNEKVKKIMSNKWNEEYVPLTEMKRTIKNSNLTPLLLFFKEKYIAYKRDFNDATHKLGFILPANLREEVNGFFVTNNTFNKGNTTGILYPADKNPLFIQDLKAEINIIKTQKYGATNTTYFLPIDNETLENYFKEKGFWSPHDEYKTDTFTVFNKPVDEATKEEQDMIKQTLDENAKLKKEIEELKMKLKVLTKDDKDDIKECKKEKVKKEKVKEVKKEKVKEVKKEKVKEVKEVKKEKVKEDKKKDNAKSEVVITLDFDKCVSDAMCPKEYDTEGDEIPDDNDTVISNNSNNEEYNTYDDVDDDDIEDLYAKINK